MCWTRSLRARSTSSSMTRPLSRELTDGYRIRRAAVEASVACLTSLDTAACVSERARVLGRAAALAPRVPSAPLDGHFVTNWARYAPSARPMAVM